MIFVFQILLLLMHPIRSLCPIPFRAQHCLSLNCSGKSCKTCLFHARKFAVPAKLAMVWNLEYVCFFVFSHCSSLIKAVFTVGSVGDQFCSGVGKLEPL